MSPETPRHNVTEPQTKQNGDSPYWVMFDEDGNHFFAGPYSRDMAEVMADELGGIPLRKSLEFDGT